MRAQMKRDDASSRRRSAPHSRPPHSPCAGTILPSFAAAATRKKERRGEQKGRGLEGQTAGEDLRSLAPRVRLLRSSPLPLSTALLPFPCCCMSVCVCVFELMCCADLRVCTCARAEVRPCRCERSELTRCCCCCCSIRLAVLLSRSSVSAPSREHSRPKNQTKHNASQRTHTPAAGLASMADRQMRRRCIDWCGF